jgi:hypothetical protein
MGSLVCASLCNEGIMYCARKCVFTTGLKPSSIECHVDRHEGSFSYEATASPETFWLGRCCTKKGSYHAHNAYLIPQLARHSCSTYFLQVQLVKD